MADLHHKLDSYYKPASQYKNLKEGLEKELGDKNSRILAAEEGNRIIGYLRGSVENSPEYASPEKIGIVYDLFVDEKSRKEGIGQKLLEQAIEWFKGKKIENIELSVDARNQSGVKFWEKSGFFTYKLRMRMDLDN